MRISDWSSDVCSSDLKLSGLSLGHEDFTPLKIFLARHAQKYELQSLARTYAAFKGKKIVGYITLTCGEVISNNDCDRLVADVEYPYHHYPAVKIARLAVDQRVQKMGLRSEEHTSELQSLLRISYAVF